MRVLYVSPSYTVHDRRFIAALAGSGHDVIHARFGGPTPESRPLPPGAREAAWPGRQAAVASPADVPAVMRDFVRLVADVAPDVIQAGPVQTAGLMAALTGFHPLVIQSWGSDMLVDADRDAAWGWATDYALRRMDALVCDCDAVRNKVARTRALPDDRVAQFPWGIDLREFRPPDPPRPAPAGAASVSVLSLRAWEPHYGVEVLLRGFAIARKRDARLRLTLAGDGSLGHAIHRFIADHGLDGCVATPGRVPNDQLPDVYRAADVYASCAFSDGSSVSLIEALATGLPAVVTDVESNREWIAHGDNGWLAPAGDADAVAQCLSAACGLDAERRMRIAAANRGIAEARADWAANARRLLDLISRLT